jgi:hypothetical protein
MNNFFKKKQSKKEKIYSPESNLSAKSCKRARLFRTQTQIILTGASPSRRTSPQAVGIPLSHE